MSRSVSTLRVVTVATVVAVVVIVAACVPAASPSPDLSGAPPTPAATPRSTPSATATPSTVPTVDPSGASIAAGYQFTCVLTSDHGVTCWGANHHGQLGIGGGPEPSIAGPAPVYGLTRGVVAVAAGESHACALLSSGGVKCWGGNDDGQLGNDHPGLDSFVPVDVVGLGSGVRAITAAGTHSCALLSTGGVKCWGDNALGALGNGTQNDSGVPVDVSGLEERVTGIAAGGRHTCALLGSGAVRCWGDGQSEDPNIPLTPVPARVPGLASEVTHIAAGSGQTCALTTGASLVCWGANAAPPAGEPSFDRFASIDLSGLTGVARSVVLGETHACVLTDAGRVGCWGLPWYGQLGRFTPTGARQHAPFEVPGLVGAVGVAVGGQHTCATTEQGGVVCWGSNAFGQLGGPRRCSSTSVPVDVRLTGQAPTPTEPPAWTPIGRIEHPGGATDVVLRLDIGPDLGAGEVTGEFFMPGPEFTLYGDGRVIFRDTAATPPPPSGAIVRGVPFLTVRLADDEMQSLLRFALGDGGLASACERYETTDVDGFGETTLTVRAGGFERRVELRGPNPLGTLVERLRHYRVPPGLTAQTWIPDRYWGALSEAATLIELGILPPVREVGSAPWPWPTITPADFTGRDEGGWIGVPRRVMTPNEASALSSVSDGVVVKRVYLVGPDGSTIYAFSMWPVSPDELP